jgi:hypothetical protein
MQTLPFLRESCNVAGMTSVQSAARFQFFGLILMSVALGMVLLTVFDKWLRGDSFAWWLLLAALNVFAISTNCMVLLKRIP